jgi:hypothetical protein
MVFLLWKMGSEAIKKRFTILAKLAKAGALSRETAVSPDKAHLNWREREWLVYLAGGMERIGKTENGLYYDSLVQQGNDQK